MSKSKRCVGKTLAGKDCRAYAVNGSRYCIAHDPALRAQQAAWRSDGGKARAIQEGKAVELLTVDDVRQGLAAIIGSLWNLHNTNERGRALISAYLAALRTFELIDLAERIAAIELRLEDLKNVNRL